MKEHESVIAESMFVNESSFLSVSWDGTGNIIDIENKLPILRLKNTDESGMTCCDRFLKSSRPEICIGRKNGRIQIWDIRFDVFYF